MVNIQEEERTRIARDLHDRLGQELVSMRLEALCLAESIVDHNTRKKAQALAEMVALSAKTVQELTANLRPQSLDSLGLVNTIQIYAEELERKTKLPFHINIRDGKVQNLSLSKGTKDAAFRIVQEALTNVIKHSMATLVKIAISFQMERLVIQIEDNGKGFDVSKLKDSTSLGLLGMQERARIAGGVFHVYSKPQKGTKITIRLPP
jgi:signal transduction histidine kinase